MINLGIFGSSGRVGKLLIELACDHKDIGHVYAFTRSKDKLNIQDGHSIHIIDDFEDFLNSANVIIDFSIANATEELLAHIVKCPKPLIIGTTGLNKEQDSLIKKASLHMPILYSSNMSLGIALLKKISYMISDKLRDFDIEILDIHHRGKKDAPSGTAMDLAKCSASARGLKLDDVLTTGRRGLIGARDKAQIGVLSQRGGDIIGAHSVGFYGIGEFIELKHTATNRNTFSLGALKASKWIINQPNGLYSMDDFLDINA